jgi:hypothetical protein
MFSNSKCDPEIAIPTCDCMVNLRKSYAAHMAFYMSSMEDEFLFIFQKDIGTAIE